MHSPGWSPEKIQMFMGSKTSVFVKKLNKNLLYSCSDKQTISIVAFVILIQILGVIVGTSLFQPGYSHNDGNIFSKLLTWDGKWYLVIGNHAYVWNQAYCAQHYCQIAFFPLQGVIDKFLLTLLGHNGVVAGIIILSWIFGILSIFCFARFARSVMGSAAKNAIFLYAFYPGSVFCLMGYPVGIFSIFIILALHYAIKDRWWWSAFFLGLASSAAPTAVFVGFPIGLYYLHKKAVDLKAQPFLMNAVGWTGLALSGLILFMLYQYLAFGDATAFITAQTPWGGVISVREKLAHLVNLSWYVHDYNRTTSNFTIAYHQLIAQHNGTSILVNGAKVHMLDFVEMILQSTLNIVFFVLGILGIVLTWFFVEGKKSRQIICASGLSVFLGYMWFLLASAVAMQSTIRLLYPAMAIFIGLGGFSYKFKVFEYALYPFFVVCTFFQIAFVVAGYVVI